MGSAQQQSDVAANTNSWNLGGFWVSAYETTPWTKLFPQLNRTFPQNDDRIYVTRLWLYYLTRIEFLQYLRFQIVVLGNCSQLPVYWTAMGSVTANLEQTENDANLFSILCDGLKKEIVKALKKPDFSQVDYLDQILAFDDKLRIENRFNFRSSIKVYDTFFDNYDVFHNNPLGFIGVRSANLKLDTLSYWAKDGWPPVDCWLPVGGLSIPALLPDARRHYPMINIDGRTVMVIYGANKYVGKEEPLQGRIEINEFLLYPKDFLRDYHKEPKGGTIGWECYNLNLPDANENTYYGANYNHLDINSGKMFGVPFLSRLPFDNIVLPLHSTGA